MPPVKKELDLLDEVAVRDYFSTHEIDIVIHGAVRPGHRNAADPSGQLYQNTRMSFSILECRSVQKNNFYRSGQVVSKKTGAALQIVSVFSHD